MGMTPWSEGAQARAALHGPAACPYDAGEERKRWLDGWIWWDQRRENDGGPSLLVEAKALNGIRTRKARELVAGMVVNTPLGRRTVKDAAPVESLYAMFVTFEEDYPAREFASSCAFEVFER